MSKDVQMTFRVEPELRSSFSEATELEHRPAAQVLRELMREYVELSQSRKRAPASPLISAAERKRRQEVSRRADASLRLEGLTESPAARAIGMTWERGEITGDEMIERVRALYIRHD